VPTQEDPKQPRKPGAIEHDEVQGLTDGTGLAFDQLVERSRTRFLSEMVPEAWAHAKRVAAAVAGAEEQSSLSCAIWMYGNIGSRATWVTGPRQPAVRFPDDNTIRSIVEKARQDALARGEEPLCVVEVRYHGESTAENRWPEEEALRAYRQQLAAEELAPSAPDLEEIELLAKLLGPRDAPGSFRVLLVAGEDVLAQFGLPTPAPATIHGAISPWDSVGLLGGKDLLASWIAAGKADALIALTSALPECDRRKVRDEKSQRVQVAASELLDLMSLDQASGLPADPRGALRDTNGLWQSVRSVVKERLESIILALSKCEFETFEEKRQVAAELREAMDKWGFRAKSPYSGKASILRCRQGESVPRGAFSFDEVPEGPESTKRRSPRGGTAQIPAFELVDRPADRRRTIY
jgi:hypothetical protein